MAKLIWHMSQSKLESPFLSKMAVGPRRAHGCTSPLAYIMKIRTRIVTTAPPCPSPPCEAIGQKTAGVSVLFCFVFVSFSVCVICVPLGWSLIHFHFIHSQLINYITNKTLQKQWKTRGNAAEIFFILFWVMLQNPEINMIKQKITENCTFSCFQKVWNFLVLWAIFIFQL